MQYQNKTHQFHTGDIETFQKSNAELLAASFIHWDDPLVALRAMAEIMLNEDEEKLKLLLADKELTALWRTYTSDPEVNDADHGYAKQLEEKLKQIE